MTGAFEGLVDESPACRAVSIRGLVLGQPVGDVKSFGDTVFMKQATQQRRFFSVRGSSNCALFQRLEDRQLMALTLDTAFGGGVPVDLPARLGLSNDLTEYSLILPQPDGSIFVTGSGSGENDRRSTTFVAKLRANGSFDNTFGRGGIFAIKRELPTGQILVQPDGSLLLNNWKLTRNGWLDRSFGGGDGIGNLRSFFNSFDGSYRSYQTLRVNPDGTLLVLSQGRTQQRPEMQLVTVSADGNTILRTVPLQRLSGSGVVPYTFRDADMTPDNKVLITGARAVYRPGIPGTQSATLFRFNLDGSPDTSLGCTGVVT
jgi:hypothetical protein